MCSPSVLVAHTEDAEKYQYSASNHGADINILLDKLGKLTSGQATILQLELVALWREDEPDLEKLIKKLV